MSLSTHSAKQIWIIGLGIGGRRLVTRPESAALKHAQLYIGWGKAYDNAREYAAENGARLHKARRPAEIRRAILDAAEERIVVLTEGDPGTSGELDALWPSVRDLKPTVFPGVTIASYMASRAGMSCAGAPIVDLRTGQTNLAEICRRNQKVLVCSSSDLRPVMRGLAAAGFGKMVACVCEYPGEESEKLTTANVRELCDREITANAVILLVRSAEHQTGSFGIRDDAFSGVSRVLPSELRAVLMSRLNLKENATVYVIGSSAGDVVVEAAAAAKTGIVYAIEAESAGAQKTLENCRRFGSRNVRVIEGKAPGALGHIEPPDAVIIRGCAEATADIIQIAVSRNPSVRIAVITHSPETAVEAAMQLEEKLFTTELLSLSDSRSTKKADRHTFSDNWSAYLVVTTE